MEIHNLEMETSESHGTFKIPDVQEDLRLLFLRILGHLRHPLGPRAILSHPELLNDSIVGVTSKKNQNVIKLTSIYHQCHKNVTSTWRHSGIMKEKFAKSCQK